MSGIIITFSVILLYSPINFTLIYSFRVYVGTKWDNLFKPQSYRPETLIIFQTTLMTIKKKGKITLRYLIILNCNECDINKWILRLIKQNKYIIDYIDIHRVNILLWLFCRGFKQNYLFFLQPLRYTRLTILFTIIAVWNLKILV